MFDSLTHPIKFPPYRSVAHYEGMGNWAVDKYYKWPLRYFYRHKIRMIERMLRSRRYTNIMDFGGGPGLFHEEWKKYGKNIYTINEYMSFPIEKMDLIICASVMEFVELDMFQSLSNCLNPGGDIIVASPMSTEFSTFYFGLINDRNYRHSHHKIINQMSKVFNLRHYKTWADLYFCAMGKKR